MNGMQRFLSRREKHQAEKRKSKEAARNKVRSISANSFIPLLCPACDTPSRDWQCRSRQNTSSLESLYHKLPSVLRSNVEDRLSFLHAPCRATSTPLYTKASTIDSSDHMPLQRKSGQPVSSDLYKIFTNEDSKPTADKDASKNVRTGMGDNLV
jgi:hypothetical protein